MNAEQLKKFMFNTAWSFISAVATKISVVITGILVARALGTQSFGEYGLIQSAIVMLANVAAQTTTTATAKHIGQFKGRDLERIGKGITLTLIFSLAFIGVIGSTALAAPTFFAETLLGSATLGPLSIIVLSTIALIILSGWTQGCLTGWGQYRAIAAVNGAIAVLSIPATYYLTVHYQLTGALVGLAGSQLLIVLVGAVVCWRTLIRHNISLRFKNVLTEKHALLSVGLPVLLTGLMVAPINWLGNKLLVQAQDGLSALGIYAAAMQWNAIFSHVSIVLGSVLIPMLASRAGGESRKLEALNFLAGWLVVLVIIQPVILFPEMLTRLYGSGFLGEEFETTLILVILASLLNAYKSGISRKMIVMDLAWYSVMSNIFWGVLFITGVWFFRDEGAQGIAKVFIGSQLIHFVLGLPYFIVKRILPVALIANPIILSLWCVPLVNYTAQHYIQSPFYRLAILIITFLYIALAAWRLNRTFSDTAGVGKPL